MEILEVLFPRTRVPLKNTAEVTHRVGSWGRVQVKNTVLEDIVIWAF